MLSNQIKRGGVFFMTMHAKRASILSVGLVFIVSVMVSVASIVRAQQSGESGGSGLSISDTRNERSIEKGKSDEVEISLRNVTKGAIVAKPFIADFESDNETGEPKLLTDTTKRSSATIAPFVKGLSDVPLAPGESKKIKYPISVPADTPSGAYYGAIVYRAVPANQVQNESDGGQVALTANVASLLLVEVPGDIVQKVQITSLKAQRAGKTSSFFTSAPDKSAVTIKNLGNGFSKPFGTVAVTDMSGKQVHSYEINDSNVRSNILPKTARTFTDDLKNVKKPGRYTITANISFGSGGEVIVQKASFWYIPTWLLITIIVLILGLGIGGFLLYRKQFGSHSARRKH